MSTPRLTDGREGRTAPARTATQAFENLMRMASGSELSKVFRDRAQVDMFVRVAKTAVMQDLDLLECALTKPAILMTELMKCAADGLMPDKREAAVFVLKGVPTYWPMVQGVMKRLRNSGHVKSIRSRVVRHSDHFEIEYGLTEKLVHIPSYEGEDAVGEQDFRGVYAVVELTNGAVNFEYMSKAQIDRRKKVSRVTYNGNPWAAWHEEMARKTVVKAVSKYLPMSPEDQAFMDRADKTIDGVAEREDDRFGSLPEPAAGKSRDREQERGPERAPERQALEPPAEKIPALRVEREQEREPEYLDRDAGGGPEMIARDVEQEQEQEPRELPAERKPARRQRAAQAGFPEDAF